MTKNLISSSNIIDIINKDIKDDSKLDYNIADIYDYANLPNIGTAVDIIANAVKDNKHIRVVGDYDVDGMFATYVLVSALQSLGVDDVDFSIPNRIRDGYGINSNICTKAITDKVDLVITCDNGVTANEALDILYKNNVTTIVTDHHEPSDTLPVCAAIVDPKLSTSTMDFKDICGAVVAFKVMVAVFDKLDVSFDKLDGLLAPIAFATVSDVMPVEDVNIAILGEGLKTDKVTKNIGIDALVDELNKRYPVSTEDIKFYYGPCFNAASRMDNLDVALKLIFATDVNLAKHFASQLHTLNTERKSATAVNNQSADVTINTGLFDNDSVIILELHNTTSSLTGITAGHIVKAIGKPAIVIVKEDNLYHGSCRAPDNFDMYEALSNVSDLLVSFGGHRQAAGLTFEVQNLEELRKRLNTNASSFKVLKHVLLEPDYVITLDQINAGLVSLVTTNVPINPIKEKYIFATYKIRPLSARLVGEQKNICQTHFNINSIIYQAVVFNNGKQFAKLQEKGCFMDICYSLTFNEYKDYLNIQLVIEDFCEHVE